MIERRADPTPAEQMARSNEIIANYNRRLLWLAGVTAALLIALLVFALVKIADVADDAKNAAEASEQNTASVKVLVEQQAANDRDRQRLIDQAVSAIAKEQYRALVAHDNSVKEYLERSLRLLNQEVNSPANKERPVAQMRESGMGAYIPVPEPLPAPAAVAPAPQPTSAPPAAPPCQPRGKSGKCKR